MAKELYSLPFIEHLNEMLLDAWEHGARHIALRTNGPRVEMKCLGIDGSEQTDCVPLLFEPSARRLCQLNAKVGRLQVNIGGRKWKLDIAVSHVSRQKQIFLHMRQDD